MLKASDAYDAAIEYLMSDAKIKDEIGSVKGFGLFPTGAVSTTTINGVETGKATFEIIIKGTTNYKDVIIELDKAPDKFWTVVDVR